MRINGRSGLSGVEYWTLDNGHWWTLVEWSVDIGQWTMDSGHWTTGGGHWTLGCGQWTGMESIHIFTIEW